MGASVKITFQMEMQQNCLKITSDEITVASIPNFNKEVRDVGKRTCDSTEPRASSLVTSDMIR